MLEKPSLKYYRNQIVTLINNIEHEYGKNAVRQILQEKGYLDPPNSEAQTQEVKKMSVERYMIRQRLENLEKLEQSRSHDNTDKKNAWYDGEDWYARYNPLAHAFAVSKGYEKDRKDIAVGITESTIADAIAALPEIVELLSSMLHDEKVGQSPLFGYTEQIRTILKKAGEL